jgi:hypothetical protein
MAIVWTNSQPLERFKVEAGTGKKGQLRYLSCKGWVSWEEAQTYVAADLKTINFPKESTAVCWVRHGNIIGHSPICH